MVKSADFLRASQVALQDSPLLLSSPQSAYAVSALKIMIRRSGISQTVGPMGTPRALVLHRSGSAVPMEEDSSHGLSHRSNTVSIRVAARLVLDLDILGEPVPPASASTRPFPAWLTRDPTCQMPSSTPATAIDRKTRTVMLLGPYV